MRNNPVCGCATASLVERAHSCPPLHASVLEHGEIFEISLATRKRLFARSERAARKRAADVGVHVDAGIDVNAYIGRSLSGRTLTACKEALASCQAYLEDFSVLENARVQWRARVSALY